MLISIVGASGSGKSFISKMLCDFKDNILIIDIDKIGHEVLTYDSVKEELIKAFGKEIIKDNSVDRKALSSIVFNKKEEMDKLTDITWKHMEEYIDKYIQDNKDKIIILDWILLPKTKYFNLSEIKIYVDAPFEIRLKRAIKRDNISYEKFIEREKAKLDYSNCKFDYFINNIDLKNTKRKVKKIYEKSIMYR